MDADSDLCPQVYRQLLQDFILSHDLFVDVKMLVPAVDALAELLADVVATQIGLDLRRRSVLFPLHLQQITFTLKHYTICKCWGALTEHPL